MTADYGSDFAGIEDLDPNLTQVSGRTALLQSLLRRIITPRGGLFYAPQYGVDIRAFTNTTTSPRIIEQAIESEMLADERVQDARATLTVTEPTDRSPTGGQTWEIELSLETAEGPFAHTLTIDAVTGEILRGI